MQPAAPTMGRVEWALLVLLATLWGTTFFWAEIALREVPPFTIVLVRVTIAAAILTALALARGFALPRTLRGWLPFLILSTLNGWLPFSLIFWAQTQLPSSVTAIYNSSVPLFVIVLAHVLTPDEKLTANRLMGVVVGMGGVAILFGPELRSGWDSTLLAQCGLLLANMAYALAAIFAKRFKGAAPLQTASCQMICATLCILPVALIYDRPWTMPVPSPAAIVALLALAVLATAVAYIIYFRILATAGAVNLMLVTLLIPVVAIVLGVALLGEALASRHVAGMAIIALALLFVDGRVVRGLAGALRRIANRRSDVQGQA